MNLAMIVFFKAFLVVPVAMLPLVNPIAIEIGRAHV